MKKKKNRKILIGIAVFLLVCGIGIIAYPHFLRWMYDRQIHKDYQEFVQELPSEAADDNGIEKEETKEEENVNSADRLRYEELYRQMREYNQRIYENGQAELTDPWAYEQPSFNLTEYGFNENVIGYVEIPKIHVVLPIYLGASQANMEKGAVHLSQTSLPIGGENTNCVIAGHRGYYGAKIFQQLVELDAGDEVLITNFWETMTYQVVDTRTILSNEIDKLRIQEGQDILSLFTCYYQENRKDRFVVYCKRDEE